MKHPSFMMICMNTVSVYRRGGGGGSIPHAVRPPLAGTACSGASQGGGVLFRHFRLFKSEIKPTWEDAHNAEGGRWVAWNIPKSKRSKLWGDIVMAMVGELTQDNSHDSICGVVLSTRYANGVGFWCSASKTRTPFNKWGPEEGGGRLQVPRIALRTFHPISCALPGVVLSDNLCHNMFIFGDAVETSTTQDSFQ